MSNTPTKCPDCINHPGIVYAYAGPGAVKEIQCPACNNTGYAPTPDQAGERFDEAAKEQLFASAEVGMAHPDHMKDFVRDTVLALLPAIRTAADDLADARVKEARIDELKRILDNIHQGTLEPAIQQRLTELSDCICGGGVEGSPRYDIFCPIHDIGRASTEGKGVGDGKL